MAIDPGFNPDRVLTVRVSIPRQATAAESDASAPLVVGARTLLDRVRALPGVAAASLVSDPPLSGLSSAVFYSAEGQAATGCPDHAARLRIHHRVHARVLRNHWYPAAPWSHVSWTLRSTPASRVVLVSEHVATRFWPGTGSESASGIRDPAPLASQNPWLTIVGVVVGDSEVPRASREPD